MTRRSASPPSACAGPCNASSISRLRRETRATYHAIQRVGPDQPIHRAFDFGAGLAQVLDLSGARLALALPDSREVVPEDRRRAARLDIRIFL